MKKIISILFLLVTVSTVFAKALICLPALSGGGWDCFGSNGSCSATWSTCACSSSSCSGGSGSSSGCSTCCCNPALALHATNCSECVLTQNGENHLLLSISGGANKDLGNISQLSLSGTRIYQYTVDQVKKTATFTVYDGTVLYNQVQASGHITDKAAAFVATVVLSYT